MIDYGNLSVDSTWSWLVWGTGLS